MSSSPLAPFPIPAPGDWQERWVEAVLATPGVNTPRSALQQIAPFIVRPKDSLTAPDEEPDGVRRLRPGTYRWIPTDAGRVLTVTVRMHGVGGIVWEHNERISSSWRSVVNPAHAQGAGRALAAVRSWKRVTEDGSEVTFAALESSVPDRETLVNCVNQAVNALTNRDHMRGYDLKEDLVLNGQVEPCMYVPQLITLAEEPPALPDGSPRFPGAYWGWMAVRGNNRTKYRQDLFGLSSAEVLTGVPFRKLGHGNSKDISVNASFWLKKFSERLNADFAEAEKAGETDTPAQRVKEIASVESHLVIGCPTPERLFRIVQGNNRRDHVHPPLEFGPNDRGRALGRGVLGAYSAYRLLDDGVADVLAGLAPITTLPGVPADASVSELRDARSMRILAELFPTAEQGAKRRQIRVALGEPAPSQLSLKDVNRRVRAWSALTSESYPHPWNPRVAEVLPRNTGTQGITLSGRPLRQLLDTAESDQDAFEELLAYRAPHWLAAFDIIDADRGSIAGQKIDDDGVQADKVRRSVTNSIHAMRMNRVQAIGLLRELAVAMDEGDRPPMQVDENGAPIDKRATRAWFNRTFTKESGTRPRGSRAASDAWRDHEDGEPPTDSGVPESTIVDPAAPTEAAEESDMDALRRLRTDLEHQIAAIRAAVRALPGHLEEMSERATLAGLDHALEDEDAQGLAGNVTKILSSLREVPERIIGLGPA
ncbi:hypothetical protein [Streptomyces sp. NPDC089799]|uniref:hypothetical protein n=1 Tax=Streptomyces sp. NPDC089799 TaxID=3155066 RepID=UPI00343F3566